MPLAAACTLSFYKQCFAVLATNSEAQQKIPTGSLAEKKVGVSRELESKFLFASDCREKSRVAAGGCSCL